MSGCALGPVAFNYALWSARFPEIAASVGMPLAEAYFAEAALYLDNTACSPVRDNSPFGARITLLNMLVAHIALLNAPIGGQPNSGLVGRVSAATQGSVSVAVDMALVPGTAAWYMQTQPGAAFYAASAPYRGAAYVPAPQIPLAQQSYPFFIGPGFIGAGRIF